MGCASLIKTIFMGMLERGGKVCAGVIKDRSKGTMQPVVLGSFAAGAHIITDEMATYRTLRRTPITTRSSITSKAM